MALLGSTWLHYTLQCLYLSLLDSTTLWHICALSCLSNEETEEEEENGLPLGSINSGKHKLDHPSHLFPRRLPETNLNPQYHCHPSHHFPRCLPETHLNPQYLPKMPASNQQQLPRQQQHSTYTPLIRTETIAKSEKTKDAIYAFRLLT